MLDRRMFLKSLVAGAAGLVVPDRRVWALDRTMIPSPMYAHLWGGKTEWDWVSDTIRVYLSSDPFVTDDIPVFSIAAIDAESWPTTTLRIG